MLVHHHIKYKEIHGYDEVVLMEKSEHRRLHNRLRREGKCNTPAPVLAQVSHRANHRRDEYKERQREYFAKWYTENKERALEQAREYKAKHRTVLPRLRPDIVNTALTRPCAALL